MGYACDAGDGNAASVLISNLDSGDILAACGNHVAEYIGQMAQAMGLDLPHPGMVSLDQLVAYATARDDEIDTIKASGVVRAGRHAELQTVMEALAGIIGGAEINSPGSDSAPAQWSESNAVEAARDGLGATEVDGGVAATVPSVRPDAGDPAPY